VGKIRLKKIQEQHDAQENFLTAGAQENFLTAGTREFPDEVRYHGSQK
jgi:hypothetical protein